MCMCSDRYFRHDIHASLDLKLRRLMAVHGAEGYGNYWLIIELLSQLSADEGKEPRMQFDEYYVAALIHTKKYSMIGRSYMTSISSSSRWVMMTANTSTHDDSSETSTRG